MCSDQAWQVIEQQLGHLISQIVTDPLVSHQDIDDGRGGNVGVLTVIGLGRDGRILVGVVANLRYYLGGNRYEDYR
ncbi:hypothetical protein FQZ97_814980 [compost metagenome]